MSLSRQFMSPPKGYGIVPFYWWIGEPLTRERIAWQLDRLAGHAITGLQINYAHSSGGGRTYGLTYPSEPPIFSEAWWDLVGWLIEQGRERNFSVSLSDYTLSGVGQGEYADRILEAHPEVRGAVLEWDGAAVRIEPRPYSLDPMHPLTGKLVCEYFFGEFEKHFPGEMGKGVNFFFSDELDFGLRGNLWTGDFAEEFEKRKGYDIRPRLPLLFEVRGNDTVKIRLDYKDVLVQLEEERYFKPVYDWHEQRGMIFGCDHGGRGRDVTEFGDYFRTQKYNQGPGCDQPGLNSDIIKNKVASSIAHLYERPRVWLEGFHSSGWGTSSGDLTGAIARNYAMGQNLLSLHGLYYSTYGGWWEWAPPCNCFRMPYWEDAAVLTQAVERLSFLLSRGTHVCDAAVVYPVADVEAGLNGDRAVKTAFAAMESLYVRGIDADFIDFESIQRGVCAEGRLTVGGEAYRIILIPAMEAVRYGMLEKLLEFKEAGGRIIALDVLPRYSDRAGGNDPLLNDLVSRLFEGKAYSREELLENLRSWFGTPDFSCSPEAGEVYINHRRAGEQDFYMIYGLPRGTECFFRARGTVSLWNPYDGKRYRLGRVREVSGGTAVSLPLTEHEIQLISFDPGNEPPDGDFIYTGAALAEFPLPDLWDFTLRPCLDNRFGDFRQPPSDELIGAELRLCAYAENSSGELPPAEAYTRQVRFGYGPYFQKAGPFASGEAYDAAIEAALRGDLSSFTDYEFSLRYGVWNDPGKQGYHGLKKLVSDEFLTIGEKHETWTATEYKPFAEGDGAVFTSIVRCPHPCRAEILTGDKKPDTLFIDGKPISPGEGILSLDAGPHRLTAGYRSCGRAYLVLVEPDAGESPPLPLSMRWNNLPGMLPFVGASPLAGSYGFYRFQSPPGLTGMEIPCGDELRLWADGGEAAVEKLGGGIWRVRFEGENFKAESREIVIRVGPGRNRPGGAAIDERIPFTCRTGKMAAVDWSTLDGLSAYSGGADYHTRIDLPDPLPAG
ncbi:MAG: hypothetical protein LBQ38_02030, partial [Spirochaetaceae bacterium]|nr:hypothetical protein [Spirochaetaceae bacterium]